MSRLRELFGKKKKLLSIYCTAGYPQLHSTREVMLALQENGADMMELGIPYSDPIADGPVIQQSNKIALQNGMTIQTLFVQLKEFRSTISIPVVLMGYFNPVLQYGFEKLCAEAADVGVDGLIIPDLPEHEYLKNYQKTIKGHGLDFIFLVTPETPDERIRKLDSLSSGFLYAVSSSSTTGGKAEMSSGLSYLQRIKNLKLDNPVLAGFGIADKQSFDLVCEQVNGAIIGSAFIRTLHDGLNVKAATKSFLSSILTG